MQIFDTTLLISILQDDRDRHVSEDLRSSAVPAWKEKKWGTKLMCWGGFSARGVLPLVFLKIKSKSLPRGGSFNNKFYRKKVLKPCLREINRRTEETADITTKEPAIILCSRCGRFFTKLFQGDDWKFQQDGATPHTAGATIQLLESEFPDYGHSLITQCHYRQ